ncbi:MAG: hypothetical protein P8Y99_16255, partial [Calditrichaceae bacterium]
FNFLSGGVPGGVLVLIFLIVASIIFFRLLKASEIISAEKSKKQQITVPIILIFIYMTLWFAFRPPLPPERIVILPSKDQSGNIQLDDAAFQLAETLQRYAHTNLNEKYLLHRWEWLLETIGKDSMKNYSTWLRTTKRIGARYIIESQLSNHESEYEIEVNQVDSNSSFKSVVSGSMELYQLINSLDKELDLFQNQITLPAKPANNYIKAKAYYYLDEYDKSLALIKNNDDNDCKVLTAAIYMQKGLRIKFDRVKHQFVKFENPEFKRSKKILNEVMKEDRDWPGVDMYLGK